MGESAYPKPVSEVIATLAEFFRHQGKTELVELLESSQVRFDVVNYDNWNGGTTTWALRLEAPLGIFAVVEPRLAEIEKEIAAKFNYIGRQYPNDPLGEVTITPILAGATALVPRMTPSEIEVRRVWPERQFRLFLTHLSKHKVAASSLKGLLALRGVAAFVAHQDIEPSLMWQYEIEVALKSMHALAALITPDFHTSNWTDQEIGWAFGRGVLVLPVRLGADPYGFTGKIQGVTGTFDKPGPLVEAIVNVLLSNAQTHGEMRRAIVSAFCDAKGFAQAKTLCTHLESITDFTEEEKISLRRACTENSQVSKAYGVPFTIHKLVGKPEEPTAKEPAPFPF